MKTDLPAAERIYNNSLQVLRTTQQRVAVAENANRSLTNEVDQVKKDLAETLNQINRLQRLANETRTFFEVNITQRDNLVVQTNNSNNQLTQFRQNLNAAEAVKLNSQNNINTIRKEIDSINTEIATIES